MEGGTCPSYSTPRQQIQYLWYRKKGGLQGQMGWAWKISSPQQGLNPGLSNTQQVALMTALSLPAYNQLLTHY